MIGGGLFALLDDISMLMDDIATMTKIAAKKTAGILGDDLAVNAKKASGFSPSRELPVIWAITKGSFINKIIIIPFVLILSIIAPFIIKFVLIIGGIYLAYEGTEKIYETILNKIYNQTHKQTNNKKSLSEKEKIKSAIITDFILSLEIVIIALSTVLEANLTTKIIVVSIVSILATIGVYGLVALIVKIDDFGLFLIQTFKNKFIKKIGYYLILSLPYIIKIIGIIGTIAMILVAGGIFIHYIPLIHHYFINWPFIIGEFIIGLTAGFFIIILFNLIKFLKNYIQTGKNL